MEVSENESEKILKRLQEFRKSLKLSQGNFGKPIDYSQSAVSEIEKGNRNITDKYLLLLELNYGLNKEWLLEGKGEPRLSQSNNSNAKPVGSDFDMEDVEESQTKFIDLKDGNYIMVTPLVQEYAYAGYLSGFKDPEYIEELPKFTIIVNKHHKGNYQSFEVVGESMTSPEPEMMRENIYDKSIVTGREVQRLHWRFKLHTHRFKDYVIVHKTDGILVKRIIDHDVEKGIITLHSLNPNKILYPDVSYPLDEVSQIFNVVKVSQDR